MNRHGAERDQATVRRYRALLAPGTPLRDGIERILRGRTGALIVLGTNDVVKDISTGGFVIDVAFTPTALRELAKMDGAIVLSNDLERILAAGVHLMPDGALPTLETGTRHRTADRVARQSGLPVVTVSASMSTIALFIDGERHPIEGSEALLSRANQALSALARYRERLLEQTRRLNAIEVQDSVTVRDVAQVAQRLEMVRRLQIELAGYLAALGADGRLLALQLHEFTTGVHREAELIERDYAPEGSEGFGLVALAEMSGEELVDLIQVARVMGFPRATLLEDRLNPRGYRQLSGIPRIPAPLVHRLVTHFGSLQALLGATMADLLAIEGVGEQRARIVREGLTRVAESSYLNSLE